MAGLANAATWLYVPASRLPELLPKAVACADAVVIDLEDAVHPTQRPEARRVLASTLVERQRVPVAVRVNRVGTDDFAADVQAVVPLLAAGRSPTGGGERADGRRVAAHRRVAPRDEERDARR